MERLPPKFGSSDDDFPRRKFTPDEDVRLRALVDSLGTKNWEEVARFIPQRSARQCRDRYKNYLMESLMMDPWTPEEDAVVIQQFHRIGPKWVEIGKILKGRSGNNVKNRWHKHLCRRDPSLAKLAPPVEKTAPITTPAPEKPPASREQPGQARGMGEFISPTLFNSTDPGFSVDRSWNSGFSVEDSLF
jgi:hypothetical protein